MRLEIISDFDLTDRRANGRKGKALCIQSFLNLFGFFQCILHQTFAIHAAHLDMVHAQLFQYTDLLVQAWIDLICKTA